MEKIKVFVITNDESKGDEIRICKDGKTIFSLTRKVTARIPSSEEGKLLVCTDWNAKVNEAEIEYYFENNHQLPEIQN